MFVRGKLIARGLLAAIPAPRWPGYIEEVYRVLKPGGWAQFTEGDPRMYSKNESLNPDSALAKVIPNPSSHPLHLEFVCIPGTFVFLRSICQSDDANV